MPSGDHVPKPKEPNENRPVTVKEFNEWADHLYHYLRDKLNVLLDAHIHEVEAHMRVVNEHMASTVPPAHTAGKGGDAAQSSPASSLKATSPAQVTSHVPAPPEPPWEMV
jgi:hypothetical protein